MRASEIMETASAGSTSSGSIAPISAALGAQISRIGGSLLNGKYSTAQSPNTPKEYKTYKERKKNVLGQFKNSI